MANDINRLIDMIYERIEDAKAPALKPNMSMVDRDEMLDLLDELRAQLPVEIKRAQELLAAREKFVDDAMEAGKDVILDIEIQGAIQVCSKRPDTVRIFIAPPSWAELERRLTERGTDSPEKIQKRLLRAKVEFQTAHTYDYFVINDTVENAVGELNAIITAEHCKPQERMEIISGR